MKTKFTYPLDNIRIASPCKSDWNMMFGDERRRFCSECKLNVYNLSGMTREEAERLVMNSEGRLCVRFFRRIDGTILTKDCPVGWKAIKKRVSAVATAVFAMLLGLVTGTLSLMGLESAIRLLPMGDVPADETIRFETGISAIGDVAPISVVAGEVDLEKAPAKSGYVQGRVWPAE